MKGKILMLFLITMLIIPFNINVYAMENNKNEDVTITVINKKVVNREKFENPSIEILTIEDVPFYENGKLKLHCSIYQIKSDDSGYENVDLYFITDDDGETWNLDN